MKIAVITGASSGMGREMARQLDKRIPNLEEFWLIGRRKEPMEALALSLKRPARIFPMDLCAPDSEERYKALLEAEAPKIVFLVNAAGFGKIGKVGEIEMEDLLGMIDLNVRALTMLCKSSLPYMAKKSRILNFASAAAFLPQPSFSVYAAGKSFVLSFSRALNAELSGSGCRVCAVCPGPVKTEFFDIAEETGQIAAYKYLFMAKPEKVVEQAIMDSVLGRELSVYGQGMRALRLLTWLLPHSLLLHAFRKKGAEK